MVEAARAALLNEHRRCTIGSNESWIFPAPGDPRKPMSRHLARDWWQRVEAAAQIARITGRGWHSLRRKFATEMKAANLKDLCALGGLEASQHDPEVLPTARP